jgi:phosphopantetheinyl transferase
VTISWLEHTAAEVPQADWWLSRAEQEHLGGLRFDKRRSDWRLGRWTAKLAVSKSLAVPDLDSIEIRPAQTGAPRVFVRGDPAPLSISISHRDGVAMCAVCAPGALLGCDIETVEPRSDSFAADYFTPAEQAALSGANRCTTLALYWSAKESALKALGIGLGIDMLRLHVHVDQGTAGGWIPLTVRYAHLRTFHGWWQKANGLLRTIVAAPAPCPPGRIS